MPVYEQPAAQATTSAQSAQRDAAPAKKQRPADLVPEENKAVQRLQDGDPPVGAKAETATSGTKAGEPVTAATGQAEGTAAKADGAPVVDGGAKKDDKKKTPEEEEKERAAAITAKWKELLGEWLGAEAAALVIEHVSPDALTSYVNAIADAGADGLAGVIKKKTKTTDKTQEEAVKKFSEGVSGALTKQVEAWMKTPGAQKVMTAISSYLSDNPKATLWILGSAVVGGAVVAYFADPSLDIKSALKLGGGWKLTPGLDLGKLRHMAYEGASLALSNKTSKIELKHKVEGKGDDKKQSLEIGAETDAKLGENSTFKGSSNVSIAEDKVTVKLNGGLKTQIAGQVVELDGTYQTDGPVKGRIKLGEGGEYREIMGEKSGDVVTFSTKQVFAGGSVEHKTTSDAKTGKETEQGTANIGVGKGQTVTMTAGDDGNRVGYENKNVAPGLGVKGSVGTDKNGEGELKLGANYSHGMLKSNLDLTMGEGKGSLNLGASLNHPEGWKFDGTLKVDEKRMSELSLKMGYRSPDEFKGFLLGYKREWVQANGAYANHFDALLEYSIGKWYGRVMGGVDIMGNQVKKSNLDAGFGYQMNKDWMLIGGMQMNGSMNTTNNSLEQSFRPYIGTQYGGVGVAAYFDTGGAGKGHAGFMLTVPIITGKR